MSDSNISSHPDNIHIGPARLAFYDETNDLLVIPGKVENLRFERTDVGFVFQKDVISGKMVEANGRATEETLRLHGKFVETMDPNTLRFWIKNCGTVDLDDTCGINTVTEEYQVYNDRAIKLLHNNGFYGSGALPAPQNSAMTGIAAVGGSFPGATYAAAVTAVYGDTEGDYDETTPIAAALNNALLIEWDAPTGGAPDLYRIYVWDTGTDTRATSVLMAETANLNVLLLAPTDLGAYPGDATSSFAVTDTSDVAYTVGTDYVLDATCAIMSFPSTGAIENGDIVRVTYTHWVNQSVNMSIGASLINPKLARLVILAVQDDDRTVPAPRGIEIELWKVLTESGFNFDLSSLNFESGFEFTWPVLVSDETLNHGQVTTFNRHFISYDHLEWAQLSHWGSAAACAAGTS